jgi:hypothetical protein
LLSECVDDVVDLADAVRERNDLRTQWSVTDELLAQLIEWVSLLRVEQLACAGVKPYKLPKVFHVPRPGEEPEKDVVMSPRELALLTVAA